MINKLILAIIINLMLLINIDYAQQQTVQKLFSCDNFTVQSYPSTPLGMGLTKPMKTLPVNSTDAYFRVLMLFVEYESDETGPNSYWEPNSMPNYYDQLFASEKQLGIDAYEDYKISDYFNKVSRDEFDMIAGVYHVTLPHEYSYYQNHQNGCFDESQLDAFRVLDAQQFDWARYDLWKWDENAQEYVQNPDGYIDMIYIQHRRVGLCSIPSGGFGFLGVNYTTWDGKYINEEAVSYIGSGVTGVHGANMSLETVVAYFRHEFCHFTLGYHKPYSTILGGDNGNSICGSELGFSPMDMIAVGYNNTINYQSNITSYELRDLHSYGDLLKVPINENDEFFLVSNRMRTVGDGSGLIYDCNMEGDTAMGLPFKQFGDYSKGLYIYHVKHGNQFEFWQDLEAADGLWNWEHIGTATPFWSNNQPLALLGKTGVGYNDDNPETGYMGGVSRYQSRDGQSVISQYEYNYPAWGRKWFSIGKRHTQLGEQGIDRVFTNLEENWTSCELIGDRWDAWALGYNVIFSPYSSPNTKDRNNENTGIFIYYTGLSGNDATVEVYQADANTEAEDEILEATPPSKPMLFRAVDIYGCSNNWGYARITWENNLEPDMVRNGDYKRYKVYRAGSTDLNTLPGAYAYIGTYNDYTPDDTANYIDYHVMISCGFSNQNNRFYRFKVIAVDKYDDESVMSDFASTQGAPSTPDNNFGLNENPLVFRLSQNYPNPFNPSTEIKYAIPVNTYVTLKVYNMLGQVVGDLVNNEYKTAGNYSVTFDGTNLASGVYFYTIDAGRYYATKKMVLIK